MPRALLNLVILAVVTPVAALAVAVVDWLARIRLAADAPSLVEHAGAVVTSYLTAYVWFGWWLVLPGALLFVALVPRWGRRWPPRRARLVAALLAPFVVGLGIILALGAIALFASPVRGGGPALSLRVLVVYVGLPLTVAGGSMLLPRRHDEAVGCPPSVGPARASGCSC